MGIGGRSAAVAALIAAASMFACRSDDRAAAEERPQAKSTLAPPPRAAEAPVEVVTREVPGDLPVFFLQGGASAKGTVIFLHGMCGHGLGYVQAFQWGAVSRVNVIGLQGDVACDGEGVWRKWSRDLDALEARIDRALEATGRAADRDDPLLVGYSQGGTRAIELAARRPERFGRIVVIGAPLEATPSRLRRARAVVVMAGEHDAPGWRRSQAQALQRAGIHATFFELPGAVHGSMGAESERVMSEVLDWIASTPPPAKVRVPASR
jgi:predicted esterase